MCINRLTPCSGDFFPIVLSFLRSVPFIGPALRAPYIGPALDKVAGCERSREQFGR